MIEVLLLAATAGYAAAAGLYIAWMLNQQIRLRRAGVAFTILAAVALLGAGVLELGRAEAGILPMAPRVLLLIVLGGTVVFLVARLWRDLPIVGPVLTPLAAVTVLAAFCKAICVGGSPPSGSLGPFQVVHIASAILGFLLFVPAYVLSVLFLDQEYRLKTKQPGDPRGPGLMTIERMAWRLLYFGFPFYSIGILLGAVWQEQAGTPEFKPQHVLAGVSWCIYAYAIYRRLQSGWRGRRAALALMAAFVTTFGAVLLYAMR